MNKRELLIKQANALYRKAKELESIEQQKIGKAVLDMYGKKEIKDAKLREIIEQIIGVTETTADNKNDLSTTA